MPFKVAVVYYSHHGLLVTLANIIAAGARKVRQLCMLVCLQGAKAYLSLSTFQVPGAEVKVYRVKDPVRGDDPQYFEDGVLDAEPMTDQVAWQTKTILFSTLQTVVSAFACPFRVCFSIIDQVDCIHGMSWCVVTCTTK